MTGFVLSNKLEYSFEIKLDKLINIVFLSEFEKLVLLVGKIWDS